MKKNKVTIIDYGCGNLLSVKRAFEYNNANVKISSNIDDIKFSDRLVLPGVGAFNSGINSLIKRNLKETILDFVKTNKPILGICLGMQLFATESYEFGKNKGLNLIPGKVVKIQKKAINKNELKIPHVGLAEIHFKNSHLKSSLILDNNENIIRNLYMVHSYHFIPDDDDNVISDCYYGDHRIIAGIKKDNIIGVQFHPEKSGKDGLNFLAEFLEI